MLKLPTLLSTDRPFAEQLGVDSWESNWILVESKLYLLKINLYDRDKMPIELTDNLVFSNYINLEHFEIVK